MQISDTVTVRAPEADSNHNITQGQMFSSFNNGDTVQAEIVSVSGREVTLEMPNGAEVKAFFPDGVAVQAGDTIDLTVFNKDVSPIHLKLASVNGQTVNL